MSIKSKMRSLEIKRKIVENTKILIQKNASVTIKDIAKASYVNIAAVNYHFGNKEKLLTIVINEVLTELKDNITAQVSKIENKLSLEEALEVMITYIYNFSMENIGFLNYLFLTKEIQKESAGLLIDSFMNDNEFTRFVFQKLAENEGIENKKEAFAKYIILFASFSIPLFIQITQMKSENPMKIETFKDPEFREYFIKNIIKMM